jgi:hypothetical protein
MNAQKDMCQPMAAGSLSPALSVPGTSGKKPGPLRWNALGVIQVENDLVVS